MDTGRDLACAELWQASLERSLARRGRPTRSSLELFHLQPERDLSRLELLRESAMYSELRRSAASRRPSMALPGAGGISALALLAATTLPGLLSGRTGSVRTARITYRAGERGAQPPRAKVAATSSAATASAAAATATLHGMATRSDASAAAAPAHAPETRPGVLAVHVPRLAPAHPSHAAITTVHIATAADVTGGASAGSPTVSGGAPAAEHSAVAANTHAAPAVHATPAVHRTQAVHGASPRAHTAPAHRVAPTVHTAPAHRVSPRAHTAPAHRVSEPVHRVATSVPRAPARPKATTHVHTGGGAIEEATSVGHPRSTSAPARPVAHPQPVTRPKPVTHPKPVAPPKPVAHPQPVATTKPVAKPAPKPAPAPAVASGQYTNPLAGASVTSERIDQGVDYGGSGTLGAIGDGKVTYVGTSGTGWPGAFIEFQLTGGSDAGKYVYYAESISPAPGLHVGQTVHAGQPIAQINGGIEIGWGSGVGTQPLAQALGQWPSGADAGNVATPAGRDFSALIALLGGPPGKVEG